MPSQHFLVIIKFSFSDFMGCIDFYYKAIIYLAIILLLGLSHF